VANSLPRIPSASVGDRGHPQPRSHPGGRRMVINMGPQHPSTWGAAAVLDLDGERW
jgi:hypothetical protein